MRNNVKGNIPEEIVLIQSQKKTISRQLEESKEESLEVIPIFVSDAANAKTIATGITWANRYVPYNVNPKPVPVQEKRKNIPISGYRIFTLENRSEGGRAYKIISPENKYLDLREDILLDTILHVGINKNGILNGEFLFAKVGSQMKLIRYGSQLHKAIEKSMIRASNKILDSQLKEGHMYEDLRGMKAIFLGYGNSVNIEIKTKYNYNHSRTYGTSRPYTVDIVSKKCTIKNKTQLWLKCYVYSKDYEAANYNPFDKTSSNYFEIKKNQSMVEDIFDFSHLMNLDQIKKMLIDKMNYDLNGNSLQEEVLARYAPMLSFVPVGEKVKLPQVFANFWDGPAIEWEL